MAGASAFVRISAEERRGAGVCKDILYVKFLNVL